MKNKVIEIMLIAIIVLMSVTTYSLADTEKVVGTLNIEHGLQAEEGETITDIPEGTEIKVTLNASQPVCGMEYRILFDSDLFEYVKNSDEVNAIINDQKEDKLIVSYTNIGLADSFTVIFKAKKDIKTDDLKFELEDELFFDIEGRDINHKDELYPEPEIKNNSMVVYIIVGVLAVVVIIVIAKILLSKNKSKNGSHRK